MKKIRHLLFMMVALAVIGFALASPQTSDAALKTAQSTPVHIDTNGVLTSWTGPVNIGTNAMVLNSSGLLSILQNSSLVTGTLESIYQLSVTASSIQFATPQTGFAVVGGQGNNGSAGGAPGTASSWTSTGDWDGSVNAGGGGNADDSVGYTTGGNGANATVTLSGTVDNVTCTLETAPDGTGSYGTPGLAGTASLDITTTASSMELGISVTGWYGSPSSSGGNAYVVVAGSNLTTFSFFSWGSGLTTTGSGGNLDCSGCPLTDATDDEIVTTIYNNSFPQLGALSVLNIAGMCASASTQTLSDISNLSAQGWTIYNN